MSEKNDGCSCSGSFILLCVVLCLLILFLAGPSRCSCARDVADKVNEWQTYCTDSVEHQQYKYIGDPIEAVQLERTCDSIDSVKAARAKTIDCDGATEG